MVCAFCSNPVPDGVEYCPICGAYADEACGYAVMPDSYYQTEDEQTMLEKRILLLGILSLTLSLFGLPGVIFGVFNRALLREYRAVYGSYKEKAKAGFILNLIGMIIGCLMTTVFACWLLTLIGLAVILLSIS